MCCCSSWCRRCREQVVMFHLGFNVALALLFIGFIGLVGRTVERILPEVKPDAGTTRPRHLDPLALTTPSLAISCAAREALHQADVVETMLRGIVPVIRNNDLVLSGQLRQLDDTVDELYSAIKFYLTQISRRGAVRECRPGAGPTSSRSRSTWSRSATSSSACCRTSRTRRSGRAAASPTPASPRSATCTSACSATCASR